MKQSSISVREQTGSRLKSKHFDYLKSPECTEHICFAEYIDRVSKGEIQIPKAVNIKL